MASSRENTAAASHKQRRIVITNVRVFDGERLSEAPTHVVIDGSLIGTDPKDADVIDGKGGVILPGLIDAHVHLYSDQNLNQMCAFGVTTALDMGTWPADKLQALRGKVGVTDIRSAGLPATSPGSVISLMLPFPHEDLVSGPEDASRFITDRVSEGVDYIKVITDLPTPDQETLNALVAAAHEQHKQVVAHALAFNLLAMAQEAGADVITHLPLDKTLDEAAVKRMVAENRVAVPTLTMMEALSKPSLGALMRFLFRPKLLLAMLKTRMQSPYGGPRKYEHARDSVMAMYRAGVAILAGTDANAEPSSPFQIKHGEAIHRELELLVEAGLSPVDALRAATSLPAKHFGLADRGVIGVGKRADLVLISGDPLQDIRVTKSIERVWCAGIEVKPS